MSARRRRATDVVPELRALFADAKTTPYLVWIELLPICLHAHEENDVETLKRIYDYADWSFRTGDPRLVNAVAVTFYEHLVNHPAGHN